MIHWISGVSALALVLGGGLAVLGFRQFGALAAVFLLGSAGRLTFLRDIWFPAIKPLPLTPEVAFGAVALLLQAGVTAAILWPRRQQVLRILARFGLLARLGPLLVLLTVLSIPPTIYVAYGSMTSYAIQMVLGGAVVALNLATLSAMLLVPAPGLPRLPAMLTPLAAALVAFAGSAALAHFAFEGIPHVGDDLTYLFQAKTFAQGALWAPAPPEALHAGLEYYLLDIEDGRWFGTTAPGWPALLTLGVLAGQPWLVNPILTALTVLLAYSLITRASGAPRLAALTAWLMATSPWMLATGGSLMTHTTALFMLTLSWWCLMQGGAIRQGTRGTLSLPWAVAAGLAMGWLFTTRQFEGVVLGVVTGLALLTLRPIPWRSTIGYGLGCLATGLVYFTFNFVMTGNPLTAPLARYLEKTWPDTRNAFGFGPDLGPPAGSWGALDFRPGHSLYEGLVNMVNSLASLNIEALGWATGSLLGVGLLLFRRKQGGVRAGTGLLAVSFLAVLGGMVFYWFSGTFYIGPRYLFIVALPVFVAAAAGILAVGDHLDETLRPRLPVVVTLLCLSGLLVFTPWRGVSKYYQFRENYSWLSQGDFGNDIVFVTLEGDMESPLSLNDPFLPPDRPIFLRDLGSQANAAVAAAYPERGTRRVQLGPDGWEPLSR